MASTIQIRNVPEPIHRILKSRAALEGKSLSEYLLGQVRQVAEMPTLEEMRERLTRLETVALQESPEKDRRLANATGVRARVEVFPTLTLRASRRKGNGSKTL